MRCANKALSKFLSASANKYISSLDVSARQCDIQHYTVSLPMITMIELNTLTSIWNIRPSKWDLFSLLVLTDPLAEGRKQYGCLLFLFLFSPSCAELWVAAATSLLRTELASLK